MARCGSTLACRHRVDVPASVLHVAVAYGHAWCGRCGRMKDILFTAGRQGLPDGRGRATSGLVKDMPGPLIVGGEHRLGLAGLVRHRPAAHLAADDGQPGDGHGEYARGHAAA
jgi:hypothetical protein